MKNKNLLITGGSTRIGKEIAIHFSKKGWNIAIHYFKSYEEAKKLKKHNIESVGDFFYLSYDSPYKFYGRRNEVIIAVNY